MREEQEEVVCFLYASSSLSSLRNMVFFLFPYDLLLCAFFFLCKALFPRVNLFCEALCDKKFMSPWI